MVSKETPTPTRSRRVAPSRARSWSAPDGRDGRARGLRAASRARSSWLEAKVTTLPGHGRAPGSRLLVQRAILTTSLLLAMPASRAARSRELLLAHGVLEAVSFGLRVSSSNTFEPADESPHDLGTPVEIERGGADWTVVALVVAHCTARARVKRPTMRI